MKPNLKPFYSPHLPIAHDTDQPLGFATLNIQILGRVWKKKFTKENLLGIQVEIKVQYTGKT